MSRNTTPITPQTPLSFKTIPGRHRTQKWNKAPTYSYEGDDWGGYDEYDEYGANEQEPPPIPADHSAAAASAAAQCQLRGRANSFDRDDDTRQFSGPGPVSSSTFPIYEDPSTRAPLTTTQPGSAATPGRGSNDFPRSRSRPRDFTNPEQVPAPLTTKAGHPPHDGFPPRKSSLSGNSYETAAAAAEAKAIADSVTAPSNDVNVDKPLPFIRPSDIYKRIPEELRRQSQEGSRPSMESLQRQGSPSQPALTPVAEARESRLYTEDESLTSDPAQNQAALTSTSPPWSQPGIGTDNQVSNPTSPGTAQDTPARVVTAPVANAALQGQTHLESVQNTPTLTRPAPGQDPAAEILSERQYNVPVDAVTDQSTTQLQHQPSQGFRSAVHHAFDHSDPTLSRDGSQSTTAGSGVSRSDTNSTAGISPIMSRVPSAATAAMRQQRVDDQVPPIAEETASTPTATGTSPSLESAQRIPRKPSPSGHSRNASRESGTLPDIEHGYRRSLDPPSSGASPARTPAVESGSDTRLSSAMSALPVAESEAADVADQGAEVPEPFLQRVETPASEVNDAPTPEYPIKPLPNPGRGRSGTDYSIREADMANAVNGSSDNSDPSLSVAEAQRNSQREFLESHATLSSPLTPIAPDRPSSRTGTPTNGSRAGSPAKGRVREIADKYHELHDSSRRNSSASVTSSKSSWSQFGDAPRVKRQGTTQSQLGNEPKLEGDGIAQELLRPELGREESFRPDLPGGWISSVPTPSVESPPSGSAHVDSRVHQMFPDTLPAMQRAEPNESIDLTPTTQTRQLSEGPVSGTSTSVHDSLKNVGTELGAALVSTVGMGHQTRDFASDEQVAAVHQPDARFRAPIGDMPQTVPLIRNATDSTDVASSVTSSAAPTPLPKDTPKGDGLGLDNNRGYFSTVAPLRVRSREASPEHLLPSQPDGADPPLIAARGSSEFESDRLGDEIFRSLDPSTRQHLAQDTAGTAGALDGSYDADRGVHGQTALPPVEVESQKPGLLTTRFSWEDRPQALPTLGTSQQAPLPQPPSPEIKPETAYERPRSRALHVVNAEADVDSPDEANAQTDAPTLSVPLIDHSLPVATLGTTSAVSPITKSQEHLLPESSLHAASPSQSFQEAHPSPVSDGGSRLPSYYLGNHSIEIPEAPEKDHTTASSMTPVAVSIEKPAQSGAIPPFRQILAMKTSGERIQTYNDTRSTFASMNTGLDNWLSRMIEQHPEHAEMASGSFPMLQTASSSVSTSKRNHKASPSIAKFTNKFATGEGQRSTSTSGGAATAEGSSVRPSTQGGDGSRVDMDKMQARGKDFIKSAGVFGGKASAGAKGLFAKGKSRFGSGSIRKSGNEVPPAPTSHSAGPVPSSSSAANTPGQQDREHASILRQDPVATEQPAGIQAPPTPSPLSATILPMSSQQEGSTSPFRRPRSQTPSSTRTAGSRPMSLVLDRLRSKGRSLSRSSTKSSHGATSASRSRPTSLVVTQADVLDAQNESAALADFSNVAVKSARPEQQRRRSSFSVKGVQSTERRVESWEESRDAMTPTKDTFTTTTTTNQAPTITTTTRIGRVVSMASPRRVESWNLPNAHIPPRTPNTRDPDAPARLGILPSPAPTAGTVHDFGERRASLEVAQRRASAAPFFKRGSGDTNGGEMFQPGASETDRQMPADGNNADEQREGEAGVGTSSGAGRRYKVVNDTAETAPSSAIARGDSESVNLQENERPGESAEDTGATTSKDPVSAVTAIEAMNDLPNGSPPSLPLGDLAADAPLQPGTGDAEGRRSDAMLASTGPVVVAGTTAVPSPSSPGTASSGQDGGGGSGGSMVAGGSWTGDVGTAQPQNPGSGRPPHRGANLIGPSAPQRPRRMSDLQLLPSQRRHARYGTAPVTSLALPATDALKPRDMSVADEINEASPATVKHMSPPNSAKRIPTTDDDEDLYDSTPVAARDMWRDRSATSSPTRNGDAPRAITGHEDEIAKMEREIAEAAASAGASPIDGIPPPMMLDVTNDPSVIPATGDARSEVSAEEGEPEEDVPQPSTATASTSRRSSVSSLGAQDTVAVDEAEPTLQRFVSSEDPIMSSQAVPAGPIATPQDDKIDKADAITVPLHPASPGGLSAVIREATLKGSPVSEYPTEPKDDARGRTHRFAERNYRPSMAERPLSYMPLPRDATGAPVQEVITTDRDAETEVYQPTGLPSAVGRSPLHLPLPVPAIDLGGIVSAPAPAQTGRHQPIPIDLSNVNGPPPGAPPFSQHPAVRPTTSVQPTEYERLRSSDTSNASVRGPPAHIDLADPQISRNSGFFRGSAALGEAAAPRNIAPPASRISDQHGIEDVFNEPAYSQPDHKSHQLAKEDKSSKRRSVLRDAFSRRSSNAAKIDASRDTLVETSEQYDEAQVPPQTVIHKVPEMSTSSSTSRRPQRAASSAVESEPKKNRLSKLGSLFGRSNTTAEEKPKSKKLTKNASSREGSQRVTSLQSTASMGSNSIAGSFRGYDAYEAARLRDPPAYQENLQRSQRALPLGRDGAQQDVRPPPEGWYGPANEHGDAQIAPQRPTTGLISDARRLHSSGQTRTRTLAQVPEAFRPVEASFKRPVEPIGPPKGYEPPFRTVSGPNSPTDEMYHPQRQPSYTRQPPPIPNAGPTERLDAMMNPERPRQMSRVSDMSQSSSGPISGRSEFYPPGTRPFGTSPPTISPVRTREGSDGSSYGPAPRDHRVGSIGAEIARSPARDYSDQQTPWSVQVPRERIISGGARPPSWSSRPWERRLGPEEYSLEQEQYAEYVSPPQHHGNGRMYQYPPQSRAPPTRGYIHDPDQPPLPNEGRYPVPRGAPMPRQSQIPWEGQYAGHRGPAYTSPVYSPELPRGYPQQDTRGQDPVYDHLPTQQGPPQHHMDFRDLPPAQQQMYHPQQQRPPPHQQRYYAAGAPPPQATHGPPHAQQMPLRQLSGDYEEQPFGIRPRATSYTGRRDDPTVGEEEQAVMRGVSYPGQEWTPEGLGRGWD